MRISIDNLDGLGALDYTVAVAASGRLKIERKLSGVSRCTAQIVEGVGGLRLPMRGGRVVVTAEDAVGTTLFSGYVASEPVRVYAGQSSEGAVYRTLLSAMSDEALLDAAAPGVRANGGVSLALDGRSLLDRMSGRSVLAGRVAVTHAFSDGDGTLDVQTLPMGVVRELADDVTVTGELEPAALITEVFSGDGATTVFTLSDVAYRGKVRSLIDDRFDQPGFDANLWGLNDPGSCLSVTSAGLTINGGNGLDGRTTLSGLDAIEMGGTIVVELGGVVLGAGSDGMLGGLYSGIVSLANCFAGFRVRQSVSGSGGTTVVVPVVNGAEVGATFAPVAGHRYRLRLRLHCVEMQRLRQRYSSVVDGVVQSFGPVSGVDAPMDVVFELVDVGVSSNTPATVLYDSAAVGPVVSTPATCSFVAANSTQMFGSVGSVRVTRPGSIWVTSVVPGGTRQTRLMGALGEGVDCVVQYGRASRLTFVPGRVPAVGERVEVRYRGQRRSVARLGAGAGTKRWVGAVLEPAARSSVDCESAAQALLARATAHPAGASGTYVAVNCASDIWPGDVVSVTTGGVTSSVLVRSVEVEDAGAVPEVRRHRVVFSNDLATEWEAGLGLRLTEQVAKDAVLPGAALHSPAVALGSLQQLAVTSLAMGAVGVDAGVAPPAGGGFEVRRRDWAFGPGNDGDVVLRSPVRNFSIPRTTQVERYFVRMYDASATPVYSRFSNAVLVTAAVG